MVSTAVPPKPPKSSGKGSASSPSSAYWLQASGENPGAEAEKALGTKFDQRKFHDFILSQGLLPPALLRKAVFEDFIGRPVAL